MEAQMSINEEQQKKLALEKDQAIKNVINLLLSIATNQRYQISEIEQAYHVFDVLQRIQAICISEVAINYDNLTQLCDEFANVTKKLALIIYDERKRIEKNATADVGNK